MFYSHYRTVVRTYLNTMFRICKYGLSKNVFALTANAGIVELE